ncbi:unnamed protein product, partial [Mesorhabditis spiculigera]
MKYGKAIELNPEYEQAMNNLANIFEAQGRYAEAVELLRRATKIRPHFATAWMNLGIAEMKMANFKLGTCYGQLNRFEEGEYHIRKAIHVDLHNKMYHSNLQVLYERRRLFSSKNSTQRNTRRYNTPLRKLGTNITGRL